MARSILFVDTYYSALLAELGLTQPPATGRSYRDALNEALDFGFGTGAAYARAFRGLGWEADVIVPNALALQTLWSREQGRRDPWTPGWAYGAHLARLPVVRGALHLLPHVQGTLLAQVAAARPDVVYVQDLNLLPKSTVRALRRHAKLLVGEIASPLPPRSYLTGYDLIVSALPSIVETARSWGLEAQNVPLGFDDRWADRTPASQRPIEAIFIGSFSRLQPQTWPLLQAVARTVPGLRVFGPADPRALEQSGLADHYGGTAWGHDMFALLGRSRIVINRHGSVAGRYAVNMRMYEATGSGAALLTERRDNLGDLFGPDEVVPYDSIEDAATKAAELLADPARLDAVAAAGQRRTLETHSYAHRAEQVRELLEARLA